MLNKHSDCKGFARWSCADFFWHLLVKELASLKAADELCLDCRRACEPICNPRGSIQNVEAQTVKGRKKKKKKKEILWARLLACCIGCNDCFLVFKWHHDLNRRISEDDVQSLDAVRDDNRPNKSLKSGLLTRVKKTNERYKMKKKLHANYGEFPKKSPESSWSLRAATTHFSNPLSDLAWVFTPCIIAAERLCCFSKQSANKGRKWTLTGRCAVIWFS